MKKELNEVQKYEIWKTKFHKQIENQLKNIFNKSYENLYILTVVCVDKWNVEFVLVVPNRINQEIKGIINSNETLKNDILFEEANTKTSVNINSIRYKIEAKTEEELNSKLMYLNIVF